MTVQGFFSAHYIEQWPKAFKDLAAWIKEVHSETYFCNCYLLTYVFTLLLQGKIKVEEHVTEGFDNMFDAFASLFTGKYMGKVVVKP